MCHIEHSEQNLIIHLTALKSSSNTRLAERLRTKKSVEYTFQQRAVQVDSAADALPASPPLAWIFFGPSISI